MKKMMMIIVVRKAMEVEKQQKFRGRMRKTLKELENILVCTGFFLFLNFILKPDISL